MIPHIKFKDWSGKWTSGTEREKAHAFFESIHSPGRSNPWGWLRNCLASWCLVQATGCAGNATDADKWIGRYRAIRGIE